MASPIYVPRVNNNDDEVKLVSLRVAAGERISRGQLVAEVETDKAVVEVEAPADGFVLGVLANVEDVIAVGSVLLWVGEHADEIAPASAVSTGVAATKGEPTAKARQLLRDRGLDASDVTATGDRLTVSDIEHYFANFSKSVIPKTPARQIESVPDIPGNFRDLRSEERGMIATVTWHRDVAVPGYIELEYDAAAWQAYAKTFADRHHLLLSPLLSLMCWRLVELAKETPLLNSTVLGDQRYEYSAVNLGFTVQAGDTLYLTVARDAQALGEMPFVNAMGELQRRASIHKLRPQEISGTTISFSSMARWKVSRHIPVLPPRTAIMIAHAASISGGSVIGASYDHRVLNGFHVVTALRKLSKPNSSV